MAKAARRSKAKILPFRPRQSKTVQGSESGRSAKSGSRNKMQFEALEPRLLLSGNLLYEAIADAALTLRLNTADPDAPIVQIVDAGDNVVASELLSNLNDPLVDYAVKVDGKGFDVDLKIDESLLSVLGTLHDAGGVVFDGGAGIGNALAGPDAATNWNLTGEGAGNFANGAVRFTGVEGLVGGSASDAFVFDANASFAGSIDGGTGSDTLVGDDTERTWNVDALDAGDYDGDTTFSAIENLTGGTANDAFVFANLAALTGTIDGGEGYNTLNFAAYEAAIEVRLSVNGEIAGAIAAKNIDQLYGGSGADRLRGPDGAGPVNWTISGPNAGSVSGLLFDGFEILDGRSAADTLTGPTGGAAWTISGANEGSVSGLSFAGFEGLVGGSGVDTLTGPNADTAWAISGANEGSVSGLSFAGFEGLVGGTGVDTLTGPNADTVWSVSGANAGSVPGLSFEGFESLVGGTGADTLVAQNPPASFNVHLEGNGVMDALEFAGMDRLQNFVPGGFGPGELDKLREKELARGIAGPSKESLDDLIGMSEQLARVVDALKDVLGSSTDDPLELSPGGIALGFDTKGLDDVDVLLSFDGSALTLGGTFKVAEKRTFTLDAGPFTGLQLDADIAATFTLTTGIVLTSNGPVFVDAGSSVKGSISLYLDPNTPSAQYGFLDVQVAGGSAKSDLTFDVNLRDPGADSPNDERITLAELDANAEKPWRFLTSSIGGSATFTLPLASSWLGLSSSEASTITIIVGYDGSEPEPDITVTRPSAADFAPFERIDAQTIVDQISEVAGWLDNVAQKRLAREDIPFIRDGLDDLFDFADLVRDAFLFDADADAGDDGARLLDADNKPTFTSLGGLETKLNELFPRPQTNLMPLSTSDPSVVAYTDHVLKIKLGALLARLAPTHRLLSPLNRDVPIAFDLDLKPLANLSSPSVLQLSSTLGLDPNFTLGIDLNASVPGASETLTRETTLESLGITLPSGLGVTAATAVKIEGRLTGDATFHLIINGTRYEVVVSSAATEGKTYDLFRGDLVDEQGWLTVGRQIAVGTAVTYSDGGDIGVGGLVDGGTYRIHSYRSSDLGGGKSKHEVRLKTVGTDSALLLTPGGPDSSHRLTWLEGPANSSWSDLAADIDAALASATTLIGTDVEGEFERGALANLTSKVGTFHIGNKFQLRSKPNEGVTSLKLDVRPSDPAARELGFQERLATDDNGTLVIEAVQEPRPIVGRLSATETFQLQVTTAAGEVLTGAITVEANGRNRSILDLVRDLNKALEGTLTARAGDSAESFGDLLEASADVDRVVLRAKHADVSAFVISNAGQLGFEESPVAADRNDLSIRLSNGTQYQVSLQGVTTIGDVIDRIQTGTGTWVAVSFSEGIGLSLEDRTFDPELVTVDPGGNLVSNDNAVFTVTGRHGSPVGTLLKIVGLDATNDVVPDGRIAGGQIAGVRVSDRFFLENANLSGTLALSSSRAADGSLKSDGIVIDGTFGSLEVQLTGSGSLSGALTVNLEDPDQSADGGRIRLAEMIEKLSLEENVDVTLMGTANLTLTPSAEGVDLADTAPPFVNIAIEKVVPVLGTEAGSGSRDGGASTESRSLASPNTPSSSSTDTNLLTAVTEGAVSLNYDLGGFTGLDAGFGIDGVLAGLRRLSDFLGDFEKFSFLNKPLPIVDTSINDLLGYAESFSKTLDEIEGSPGVTLQQLEKRIEQALGLAPSAFSFSVDNAGTTADLSDDFLRIDLAITRGFAESLPVAFDLGDEGILKGAADLQASGQITLELDLGIGLAQGLDSSFDNVVIFGTSKLSGNIAAGAEDVTFRAGLGPFGLMVRDGEINLGLSFALEFDGVSHVSIDQALMATMNPTVTNGTASATLPVYFPTDDRYLLPLDLAVSSINLGSDGTFAFSPSWTNLDELIDTLDAFDVSDLSLFDKIGLGIDGLDLFLKSLQKGLDGGVFGLDIPVLGDQMSQVADFIQKDLRKGLVDPLRGLVASAEQLTGNAIKGKLQAALLAKGILLSPEVAYTSSLEGTVDDWAQWTATLGKTWTINQGLNVDLGLPGLGLKSEGNLDLAVTWSLDIGFRLDWENGFALVLNDDPQNPELDITVTADVAGSTITGTLGFLQLTAADSHPGTDLAASFGIDIETGADSNLNFDEISRLGISATVAAEADLKLGLSLEVRGAKGFPSLATDLVVKWDVAATDTIAGAADTADRVPFSSADPHFERVSFDNVRIDIGSYVSKVLGPLVEKIAEVTEPLQPIIDILTTPLPVISDLGDPVTLIDIAGMTGKVNPDMIYAIADTISLVNDIAALSQGGNVAIPLGDFVIIGELGESPFSNVELGSSKGLASLQKSFDKLGKGSLVDFGDIESLLDDSAAGELVLERTGGGEENPWSFPIIEDPQQVFGLLLGRPAVLIGYDMPSLGVDFEWSEFFRIYGPLGVSIKLQFFVDVDFAFGYDTFGIQQFAESGFTNPLLMLNGLYISDNPKDPTGAGPDDPELVVGGSLSAAAALNVGVAEGGVGGGIGAQIEFDLFDPDHDGRIRFTELASNIENEWKYGSKALAPLAVFDVHGEIWAQLYAYVKAFGFEKTFEITPKMTLIEFDATFDRYPVLATELPNGDLQINVGAFADQRVNEAKYDKGGESVTVSGSGRDVTVVWNGYTQDYKQDYKVGSGKKIIVRGGSGDDVIDLSGVTGIAVDVDGGGGVDTITGGTANDILRGGSGDDTIDGGDGNDQIWGGLGVDTISGGADNDTIYGEAGDDFLDGDGGEDTIWGGLGIDTISGGENNDTIYGEAGDDFLDGDGGEDTIWGGLGIDTISGGENNDTIYGEAGNDILKGDGGDDTIWGGTGVDTVSGGENNDTIYGEDGDDVLNGGDGNDFIYGGNDRDTIHGDGDDDTLYGERGNDFVHGDGGNDYLFVQHVTAGTQTSSLGNDTLDGGVGSDYYQVAFAGDKATTTTTVNDTGAAADGPDTLNIIGTPNADRILLRGYSYTTPEDERGVKVPERAFVALLQGRDDVSPPRSAERIDYDDALESLSILGEGGADRFALDDTLASTFIDGGAGEDSFQVGQLFKSERIQSDFTGIGEVDTFATIETTRGWLSNGISETATIDGGAGNDYFVVFHNTAELNLFGSDGDDTFIIKAFALAGSFEFDDTRDRTDISGGLGADTVQYVVNAPVNIDGGDGFDRVIIVGTEFGDDFVITQKGVYGAGLNVNFANCESLGVDGAEGDDRFFVQGTQADVVTTIFGGLGADSFNVGGDAPPIISNDLRGHSGIIENVVNLTESPATADPRFSVASGISVNVADNDEAAIQVLVPGGLLRLVEGLNGWMEGTYTISLAKAATTNVTISLISPKTAERNADGSLKKDQYGKLVLRPQVMFLDPRDSTYKGDVPLTFAPGQLSRTVTVRANDDALSEPGGFRGVIQHKVAQPNGSKEYDKLAIPSVPVLVEDNDTSAVLVFPTFGVNRVLEGATDQQGGSDTVDVVLSKQPTGPVKVTLSTDSQLSIGGENSRTFTPENWNEAQSVTLRATNDAQREGLHYGTLTVTNEVEGIRNPDPILVAIGDDEAPTVIVDETDGSTDVAEGGQTDTYSVRLSAAPVGTGTVTLDVTPKATLTTRGRVVISGLQVSTDKSRLTFNSENWWIPQVVTVSAVDDGVIDGSDTQVFAPTPRNISTIVGPLVIEGQGGSGFDLNQFPPLMLPGETNDREKTGDVIGATLTTLTVGDDFDPAAVDLKTATVEITSGDLKGQQRRVVAYSVQTVGTETQYVLTLDSAWTDVEGNSNSPAAGVGYAVWRTNPNLLVNEAEMVDVLTIASQDNGADAQGLMDRSWEAPEGGVARWKNRIRGLGMAPERLVQNGNQTTAIGGITHYELESVYLSLGAGNDGVVVEAAHTRSDGYQTVTVIDTGAGNDSITVNLDPDEAGLFSLDAGDGNDTIDASASTLPLVLFGGDGYDAITGGQGADIIFGDRGRVDYLAARETATELVTRLGTGPGTFSERDEVNRFEFGGRSITRRSSTVHFPTERDGLTGCWVYLRYVDESGFDRSFGALVVSNTESTLTVDRDLPVDPNGNAYASYYQYRVLGIPTDQTDGVVRDRARILSVDPMIGGNDTLSGGDGNDVMLGGAGTLDTMSGGDGDDIMLGDHGRLEYTTATQPEQAADTPVTTILERVYATDEPFGGSDTISGNAGRDIVLGGFGSDTLYGDAATAGTADGQDVLLGDNGTIRFVAGAIAEIRTTDTTEATGGADTISGNGSDDVILGGVGGDTLHGDAASAGTADGLDLLLGDQGVVFYDRDGETSTIDAVETLDVHLGGADMIHGNAAADLILGGTNGDTLWGDAGADLALGDHGTLTFLSGVLVGVETTQTSAGGVDVIRGGAQEDVLIGGAYGDRIDGGTEDDLIFGDNVVLDRTLTMADTTSPRFRALRRTTISDANGNPLVDATPQHDPTRPRTGSGALDLPVWANWDITMLHHTAAEELPGSTYFGNDIIAGGAANDTIFGQLGDDTIQGDGSIDLATDPAASRTAEGALSVKPSVEAATDGDDYIEGNGGDDVIFGNLGQDDLIGDSSSLFSLDSTDKRPYGADLIFGGAGTAIARNDGGNATPEGHARDADMILGDNGNIIRLVGTNGTDSGRFLSFNYDNYSTTLRIIPRAAELIDYTPGGRDYSETAASDLGAADEIHGESGDDFIYGMVGGDILFGDGQDDDLIGGYGHDWISGGTGQDGILGDDGRISTSRNGSTLGESLYGIAAIPSTELDKLIRTPGGIQQATINVSSALKKTVDLTPFNVVRNGTNAQDPLSDQIRTQADDVIYGGWGPDFVHGGAGDDAISGAEALGTFFAKPANAGNLLGYDPTTGEFAAYDEYEPMKQIEGFLLNFDAAEGPAARTGSTIKTDGDDVLFGDLGNDWLVGGTGKDHMYGGWGDDLLNADDDLSTALGLNNTPDTDASYEDIAYGGAGRDVLIANTGGDRLIDWVGEFNSYLVPFSPFGAATITRAPQPHLFEYLYDLSESDGADTTRASDTGSDPLRNGEPDGEIGLVLQKDVAWHDQTGAPRDPQAGNTQGRRDVLRSADFNTGRADGFVPDSGTWKVANGRYEVSPVTLGQDAVSVYHVDYLLPSYFEYLATINTDKAMSGLWSNSYLIFDYQGPTDFKFAGIDVKVNQLVMGHRTATGWITDVQVPMLLKANLDYNMKLSINGTTATLVVNNQTTLSYAFTPRTDADGVTHGLNEGMIGIGANNAKARIDNVAVQVVAPETTLDETDDFADGVANRFTGASGSWGVVSGRYEGTPAAGTDDAQSLMNFGLPAGVAVSSMIELEGVVRTQTTAGFIFDRYAADDFKFVTIDAVNDRVVIGHRTAKHGWVNDVVTTKVIDAGKDYRLNVSLKGKTVSVTLDGSVLPGFVYNAAVVDGAFGVLARTGKASFDSVRFRTDDPALKPATVPSAMAATGARANGGGGLGTTLGASDPTGVWRGSNGGSALPQAWMVSPLKPSTPTVRPSGWLMIDEREEDESGATPVRNDGLAASARSDVLIEVAGAASDRSEQMEEIPGWSVDDTIVRS